MTTDTNESWFDPDVTTFGDRVAGRARTRGHDTGRPGQAARREAQDAARWEDDQSEPRANKLSMMAGLLNVSLLWLLSGEGDGPDSPDLGDLSPDISEMLTEIRDIRAQMALVHRPSGAAGEKPARQAEGRSR